MTRPTLSTNRTKRPLPILGEYSKLKSPSMFANPLVHMNNWRLVVLKLLQAALLLVSMLFSLAGEIAPRSEAARQAASERSGAMETGGWTVSDLPLRRAAPMVDLMGAS